MKRLPVNEREQCQEGSDEHMVVAKKIWRTIAAVFVVAVTNLDLDPKVTGALLAPPTLGWAYLTQDGALSDVAHVPGTIVVCCQRKERHLRGIEIQFMQKCGNCVLAICPK